jgi:hypothetical protein
MCIIDAKYFFSGDFQGQEGVCIMHQCALCNPNDGKNKYILSGEFKNHLSLFIFTKVAKY